MYTNGMTKIIYCVDLHFGPEIPRWQDTGMKLYGPQALVMLMTVTTYAKQNGADALIIGGDEGSYDANPERHLARTLPVWDILKRSSVPVLRAIGNHERPEHFNALGLNPNSHSIRIKDTNIVILQPTINTQGGQTIYAYDPKDVEFLLNGSPARNTIVVPHWSLDRMERGYPRRTANLTGEYVYSDTADQITPLLPNNTLILSGHEHRSNFDDPKHCALEDGHTHIVLPSIVQEDIDNPDIPCGIFMEITNEGRNGALQLNFKRVALKTNNTGPYFEVEDLPPAEVARYYRPYIPG